MSYIALLEAALARKSFRLHPGLDPAKYQITDNMRDAPTKWQVYCYQGFTATDPSKSIEEGQMSPVGYVMISLVDDTIIPISRGDEHHRGYDVLHHELGKEIKRNGSSVNPRDYLPVWSYGSNYIYSESDIKPMLIALTKFLSYGGLDGPLQGAQDLRHVVMNSSQFVAAKGNVTLVPDKLAPAGERIFEEFQALALAFREARNSHSPSAVGRAFQTAIKFAAKLRPFIYYLAINNYDILYKPEILNAMRKEGDLQKLEEAFFGFHGLKNSIHNQLREYVIRQSKGEVDHWKDDKIKALWGNVELAVDKFGTI